MVPVICQIPHKPPHTYGDCVRACVASIMELPPDDVPHFYEKGDGVIGHALMRAWLGEHGYSPAYFAFDGATYSFNEFLEIMQDNNPDTVYMLMCKTKGDDDHCVVGRGGEIIHDPAWYRTDIVGPHSMGFWIVIVLAKI